MLKKLNQAKTEDLTFESLHVPISYAVNDNLTNTPSFSEDSSTKQLIKDFIDDLTKRREAIIKKVWEMYPMKDPESLPKKVKNKWTEWVEQVPVLSFNGSKYDINMIKEHFVKTLADMNTVNVAKKENSYMFLMTPQFKFLDVKNYLASGLSLDAWCKSNGCEVEKQVFPYEWLDSYEKLDHVGPVNHEDFYSKLKGQIMITEEE